MKYGRIIGWGTVVAVAGLSIAGASTGGCSSDSTSAPATGNLDADAGPEAATSHDAATEKKPKPDLPGNYSITACPGVTEMALDASASANGIVSDSPCNDICGAGHCVPANTPGVDDPNVPKCSDDGTAAHAPGKCLPDKLIELNGQWVAKDCMANITGGTPRMMNLPGKCIPYCFVAGYAQYLDRGTCEDGELCTPCIDQSTGKPGGACDNHCTGDAGSTPEASTSDAPTSDAPAASDAPAEAAPSSDAAAE